MRNNDIALITGSSRGLGLEIAKGLACQGFRTLLTGRSKKNLDIAVSQLQGKDHMGLSLDFLQDEEINQFLSFLVNESLIPKIIIHNLGGRLKDDIFPLNIELLKRSIKFNLEVAIKINEKFLPFMIQKNNGRIIHIGSDASLSGHASPAYVIAKSALNGYVKTAARFYAKHNIMFCAVLPGIFEHENSDWAEKKISQPNYYQKRIEQMPLGRFGKPEEISSFVTELASSNSMMCAGALFEFRGAQ